jgi:hypothetical protein
MNYVKFLKHHVPMADLIEEVDQPTRTSFSTNNDNSSRAPSDRGHTNDLTSKLKRKVNILDFFPLKYIYCFTL